MICTIHGFTAGVFTGQFIDDSPIRISSSAIEHQHYYHNNVTTDNNSNHCNNVTTVGLL